MKFILTKNFRRFLDKTDEIRELHMQLTDEITHTAAFSDGSAEAVEEFSNMCTSARESIIAKYGESEACSLDSVKTDMAVQLLIRGMRCQSKLEKSVLLELLYGGARVFTANGYRENPYIKNIKIPDIEGDRVSLSHDTYHPHEIFEYGAPTFGPYGTSVPKLGFFEETVKCPIIYTGENRTWPSVSPNVIYTTEPYVKAAAGNVLVIGCWLGYFPYMAAQKESVQSITIVEKDPEIAELFAKYILPQFENKDKVTVVVADGMEYLQKLDDGTFDFCFVTPWVNNTEPELYLQAKAIGNRFKKMKVGYWIEDSMLCVLLMGVSVEAEYARQKAIALEEHSDFPEQPYEDETAGHVLRVLHELFHKETIDSQKRFEEVLSAEYLYKKLSNPKFRYMPDGSCDSN